MAGRRLDGLELCGSALASPNARTLMDTVAHSPVSTIGAVPATAGLAQSARRQAVGARQSAQRLESVDLFRGILMVIMLIDHVRFFVHFDGMAGVHDPLDVGTTTWLFYVTRWVTHL